MSRFGESEMIKSAEDLQILIITGLSGAGKTLALHTLEDIGFYCVDNLPPALLPKFVDLCVQGESDFRRVALVIDIRGGEFFDNATKALGELEEMGYGSYQIIFLEADDETLVKRFKETRRRHPLAPEGRVLEAIRHERERLQELRGLANHIINTTESTPQELREEFFDKFVSEDDVARLMINVVSFGFKHGLPVDLDLLFDVRFLPNPHYVDHLRERTGLAEPVREYVLKWSLTQRLLQHLRELLDFLVPHYVGEGKSHLAVGIGCTGGQHRSVAVAEEIGEYLRSQGQTVTVEHRDIEERN